MTRLEPEVGILALTFGLAVFSHCALAQTAASSAITKTTTFTSPNGDFEFRYPSWMIDCRHDPKNQSCSSYMPVCSGLNDEAMICIAYPKDRIAAPKTFDGAAFMVALVKDAHDDKACSQIPDPPPPSFSHPHTEKINGVDFWVTHTASAASSHGDDSFIYRTFQNHQCYELDINISGVSPMVYDPPRPKYFNVEAVQKALEQPLHSFKFTN